MLKTISSITNAIGALNYKGTWNATTNTPTITSSVGVKGDYYQVSVAGSTTINGISNWGVGDVIAFNGVVWQRIEGGADLNGVNLSVSGTTTLSGLTASTALALNAGKDVVSVTNTGTGDNVLATSPRLVTSINDTNGNELIGITATASAVNEITVANAATGTNPVISATGTDTNIGITLTPKGTGNVVLTSGNLVVASGNGIDFSATPGTGTSELFDDYEEGTFTPQFWDGGSQVTGILVAGRYTLVGNVVTVDMALFFEGGYTAYPSASANAASIRNLPFIRYDIRLAGVVAARGFSPSASQLRIMNESTITTSPMVYSGSTGLSTELYFTLPGAGGAFSGWLPTRTCAQLSNSTGTIISASLTYFVN
jgi:hypothetical protein